MHIGTVLIAASFGTALLFLVLMAALRLTGSAIWRRYARWAIAATFLLLSMAFALLFYSFLVTDLGLQQVWEYSGRDLDWWLKLSGAWAGRSGSLMLWTWLVMLSVFVEDLWGRLRDRRKNGTVPPATAPMGVRDWTLLLAMVPVVVFQTVLLSDSPFTELHPTAGFPDPLGAFPDGLGLNPLLRTVWMVVHPPLLFLGYAFITLPFAASIAHSLTGDRAWSDLSLRWSRTAWIFLTLGLGVGAVWAYVVLGWGGYWGWDPVEVSSLVPWVTLTAFLHAQLKNRRTGEYAVLAPTLGLATFVLVVFATYVTRGGAWVSVHAWESGDVSNISYLGLMAGSLALGGFAIYRSMPDGDDSDGGRKKGAPDPAMYATVILLAVIALMLFVGVLVNQDALQPAYYETRLMPLTLLLVLALGLCMSVRYLKKMKWYYVAGWMLVAGVIGAIMLTRILGPGKDSVFYQLGPVTFSRLAVAGFVMPSLIFAMAASFHRILKNIRGGPRAALFGAGPHVAHLGVVFILIGYVATNAYNNEATLVLSPGNPVDFEGNTFVLENVTRTGDSGMQVADYSISVSSGGGAAVTAHPRFVLYPDQNRSMAEISIITRIYEDVYIVPVKETASEGGGLHALQIRVRTLPLTAILWTGLVLTAAGMAARFLVRMDGPAAAGKGPNVREDRANVRVAPPDRRPGPKRAQKRRR